MEEGKPVVKNKVSTTLKGVVFSWGDTTNDSGIYMVEQLTIGEDMLVEIVATSFPVDDNGVPIISKDIPEKDDSTMGGERVMAFPTLAPRRSYTGGDWPIASFQSQNGSEARILRQG